MGKWPTHREKTLRAFRVYTELMDTAAWVRSWMRGPLEAYDLSLQGFRMLLMLYENGPTRTMEAAKQMRFRRQNIDRIVGRLEDRGWVKRYAVNVATEKGASKTGPRRLRRKSRAWGVGIVALTPAGQRFVAEVFPSHAKVVRALMRALHAKEQESLVEICRKLRAGAILKFVSELTHMDVWEEDAYKRERMEDPEYSAEANEREEKERRDGEGLANLLTVKSITGRDGYERLLSWDDRKLLGSVAAKMKKYDILKEAKNVDWDKPPDDARYVGNVVRMVLNVASDGERKVIERLRQRLNNEQLVLVLWKGSRE